MLCVERMRVASYCTGAGEGVSVCVGVCVL